TQTVAYPARFQLLLASNPCPCGLSSAVSDQCECTPLMRRRYKDRISGPIRDRIDIHRNLTSLSRPELANSLSTARPTAEIAQVVATARKRQAERYVNTPWSLNSEVPGVELRKRWPLEHRARALIDKQLRSQKLSARSADRILRLSWTVADVVGHDLPDADDVDAALALRRSMPLNGHMRELVQAP
ncbi:MAG: magnesium chelatase subunit ChlI family protein, partial [Aeromicrobium sp.]